VFSLVQLLNVITHGFKFQFNKVMQLLKRLELRNYVIITEGNYFYMYYI